MKLILFAFILLVGCASSVTELHIYNSDDTQDENCYKMFDGKKGYCDLTIIYRQPSER